jgi:hypothetical protein
VPPVPIAVRSDTFPRVLTNSSSDDSQMGTVAVDEIARIDHLRPRQSLAESLARLALLLREAKQIFIGAHDVRRLQADCQFNELLVARISAVFESNAR